MKTTVIAKWCRVFTTVSILASLACNSDESLQSSASDSQTGGMTEGSATDNVPTGGASHTDSLSDSEVGSNSDSHSGTESASASATVSASDTVTESASDSVTATATESASASASDSMTETDGVSVSASASASDSMTGTESASVSASDSMTGTESDSASASASDSMTDTDGSASGTTDTDTMGTVSDSMGSVSDSDTEGDVCGPGLPNNNACESCMVDNCCDAYQACVGDADCLCLVNKCSNANNTITCALLQCQVNALALPVTLGYLLQCTGECGLLCPVLGIL